MRITTSRWVAAVAAPLLVTTVVSGPAGAAAPPPAPGVAKATPDIHRVAVSWRRAATGLSSPTQVTSAPDGVRRLFIVQKGGVVRVFQRGKLLARPYLDLSGVVSTTSERGLLSIAFPRNFAKQHRLFVAYTRRDGDVVVGRLRASSARAGHVAASTLKPVLRIEHSTYGNHNGGQLQFGPDGMLYVGVGDGGGGGDPFGTGQNRNALLGKVLRIDVSCGRPYCIPKDNPFAGARPGRGEVWLYGVRNPWRFSFDRATKALWIGDVGQDGYEEVDRIAPDPRYRNLGWSCREGRHVYNASRCRAGVHYVAPVTEVSHPLAESVTGGFVYRGSQYASLLRGVYVFGDYVMAKVWLYKRGQGKVLQADRLGGDYSGPTSFGQDDAGELWAVTYDGTLWRMRAQSR